MVEQDTKNTLLQELRFGLGQTNQAPVAPAKEAIPQNADDSKQEMIRILTELKQKMAEIDKITEELTRKREEMEEHTPKRTERLLQEIKVPPLELLK